jgi:hypothetical protein
VDILKMPFVASKAVSGKENAGSFTLSLRPLRLQCEGLAVNDQKKYHTAIDKAETAP